MSNVSYKLMAKIIVNKAYSEWLKILDKYEQIIVSTGHSGKMPIEAYMALENQAMKEMKDFTNHLREEYKETFSKVCEEEKEEMSVLL